MQVQLFNPTLKTLRLVEEKVKEVGAVKNINELQGLLRNRVSHQAIKACLSYLEEKRVILLSLSGGIVYATPRNLAHVKVQGTVL